MKDQFGRVYLKGLIQSTITQVSDTTIFDMGPDFAISNGNLRHIFSVITSTGNGRIDITAGQVRYVSHVDANLTGGTWLSLAGITFST